MIGLFFGYILTGSVIIESIFSWPGNGSLFLNSVYASDYPTTMGFTQIFMLLFVMVTLIMDLSYSLVDPRIQLRYHDDAETEIQWLTQTVI